MRLQTKGGIMARTIVRRRASNRVVSIEEVFANETLAYLEQ